MKQETTKAIGIFVLIMGGLVYGQTNQLEIPLALVLTGLYLLFSK